MIEYQCPLTTPKIDMEVKKYGRAVRNAFGLLSPRGVELVEA
jgi:hypothetical protein